MNFAEQAFAEAQDTAPSGKIFRTLRRSANLHPFFEAESGEGVFLGCVLFHRPRRRISDGHRSKSSDDHRSKRQPCWWKLDGGRPRRRSSRWILLKRGRQRGDLEMKRELQRGLLSWDQWKLTKARIPQRIRAEVRRKLSRIAEEWKGLGRAEEARAKSRQCPTVHAP